MVEIFEISGYHAVNPQVKKVICGFTEKWMFLRKYGANGPNDLPTDLFFGYNGVLTSKNLFLMSNHDFPADIGRFHNLSNLTHK
jgi:hypothetical protein